MVVQPRDGNTCLLSMLMAHAELESSYTTTHGRSPSLVYDYDRASPFLFLLLRHCRFVCTSVAIYNVARRLLFGWREPNSIATEVVNSVVLPEEGVLLISLGPSSIGNTLTPTIQRGPMGAGMSMPVKEEIQVPPVLRM